MNGYDAGSDRRGKRAVQRHDEGKEVIDRGAEQAEGDVLLDRQRYPAGMLDHDRNLAHSDPRLAQEFRAGDRALRQHLLERLELAIDLRCLGDEGGVLWRLGWRAGQRVAQPQRDAPIIP